MESRVTVSVVVWRRHDRRRFLKGALDSVRSQTRRDFEIVLAKGDTTVRARNRALRRARGELIAFLDPKDRFYPRYLECMAGVFSNPGVMAAISNVDKIDGKGLVVERKAAPRHEGPLAWFRKVTGLRFLPGFSMIMLRRRALAEIGLLDEGFRKSCDDIDLLYRIGLRFGRRGIRFLDEALVGYRVHSHPRLARAFRGGRRAPLLDLPGPEKTEALDLAYLGFKHGLFQASRRT